MLDAYGAHVSAACAQATYEQVSHAYKKIFDALHLPVHKVQAPSGDMGGTLSHEWQLPAAAGEDAVDICPSCSHATLASDNKLCDKCGKETDRVPSIEVGHTFILGTKYSDPLEARYTPAQGSAQPLIMSCYGIGMTRLLAASVEALSSDTSLRWPRAIAPYSAIVIGPKEGSKEWDTHGPSVINRLSNRISDALQDDVIIDDRHNLTIGKRLMLADKIGYPNIIICGSSTLEATPRYEVRRSGGGMLLVREEQISSVLLERDADNVVQNVQ